MTVAAPKRPTLDRAQLGQALARLARYDHPVARDLYTQLASSYGHRPDRDRVTLQQLSPIKVKLLGRILPSVVVSSTRYTATYRHPATGKEITIGSDDRPPKKRTFRVPGHGSRKFTRISIIDSKINPTKESTMARKKTAAKTSSKSADTEELEGLEDVEDLADLEDTDVEEPDTEEEVEESELESMTLKDLKAKAREAGVKGVAKMKKPELIEALSAEDEEEEDDEDEEDEFDGMDRAALKKYIKSEEVDVTVKKSMSDDDIREAIRAEVGDDEEEEPEEKPAKKSAAKKSGTKPTPPNRELPKGKVGAERIAEIAKADARTVRVFLRSVEGADAKFKTDGRWAFTEKQAQALGKQLAKKQKAA